MRFCSQEDSDFPDGEFKHRNGIWMHEPPGRPPHAAERRGPIRQPPKALRRAIRRLTRTSRRNRRDQ